MMSNSNKIVKHWLIAAVALAVLSVPSMLFAQEYRKPDPVQKDKLELGKKVYFKRCVWCHGVEGEGDGPSADRLFTRPRNFIQGTFKIRVTDSGELPLDEDLIKTVKNGLPGSAMPAWRNVLDREEIEAVVQFVKTLVQFRDFDDDFEELAVQDFGTMPWDVKKPYYIGIPQEDIDAGKEIFQKNKCWECHGGEGRGDGNPTMKDDWGFPIVAADWQQCWNFRGSRRDWYNPFNVVRTISTGLNGTPMPNFKDQISVEDRWKLAAFVNSLCPRKKIDSLTQKPVNDGAISSKFTKGAVSTDFNDPMWITPEHDPKIVDRPAEGEYEGDVRQKWHYIAMAGQITRGKRNFDPKVDNLWVMSRWSQEEDAVYYLVEYHQRFLSTDPEWPEGVAIQWPGQLEELYGAEKPYFIYGDDEKPVDIWKASFLPKNYKDTNEPNPEGYDLDVSVTELVGQGFEDVKEKETPGGVEVVNAKYHQGRVKIMFKRSMKTENPDKTDVQIPTKQFIPVSFMQWAGRDKEKDEHMAISTWVYTILEPPLPEERVWMPPVMAAVFFGFQLWVVRMTRRTKQMREEGKAD